MRISDLAKDVSKLVKLHPPVPIVDRDALHVEPISLCTDSNIKDDPILIRQIERFGLKPFGEPDSDQDVSDAPHKDHGNEDANGYSTFGKSGDKNQKEIEAIDKLANLTK